MAQRNISIISASHYADECKNEVRYHVGTIGKLVLYSPF